MQTQKGVASVILVVVIVVLVVVAGFFAYQYFAPKTQPVVQTQQNQNQNNQTAQPSITVTSPNGGEAWVIGETHNITWTSTGTSNIPYINIDLYRGVNFYLNIVSQINNNGTYSWLLPPTQGAGVSGNDFKVRISKYGDASVYDESNNNFSIVMPTDQTAGWKTYTDISLGISVKYPSSWTYQKFSCNIDGVAFCPLAGNSLLNCRQTCGMNSPESPIYIHTNGLGSNLDLNSTDSGYKTIYNEMLSTFKFTK